MGYPSGALPLRVRLHLAGDWRDISDDVKRAGNARVSISRGQPPESRRAVPSKCEFELNNGRSLVAATLGQVGCYSDRNVYGPWYPHLGQNTPLDAALVLVEATHPAAVVNGWGSVDGHPWSTHGQGGVVQASDFQVTPGAATHSVPAASAYRMTYLADLELADVDVTVPVSLSITDITGGAVEPANILLRGQSIGNYYLVQVSITTAEAVTVALMHADGSILAAAVTVDGLTHTAAQTLCVRGQIEGETLRAKVWALDDGEPYDWHVSVTDRRITAAGWVGVRSGVASGNSNAKPIVFTYGTFTAVAPLFSGELGALPQTWDLSGSVAWAKVDAAGIGRRLGQGQSPLQSAPRRYIPESRQAGSGVPKPPVAYWPLEDSQLSTVGTPVIGAHPMQLGSSRLASEHFGRGELAPYLPNVAALHGNDQLLGPVDMPGFVNEWAVDHVQRNELTTTDTQLVVWTADGQMWIVRFVAATKQYQFTWPTGSATHGPFTEVDLWDGKPHHVRFYLIEDPLGVETDFYLDVDAIALTGGTVAGVSLAAVTQVGIGDWTNHTEKFSIGHVAVYLGQQRPTVDFARPVLGWQGEKAGRRYERLCTEEGIPFVGLGDLDDTELMGAQRVATALELLDDAATADGGIAYEPRGVVGRGYRTRTSLLNQASALPLTYTTRGHIAGLIPVPDDRSLRNEWTIERSDGGVPGHYELTTGPMSTLPPPVGKGRYDDRATVVLYTDPQAQQEAEWRVWLGTTDAARYDTIAVNVLALEVEARRTASASFVPAITSLRLGDRVTIADPPIWCGPDDVSQQALQTVMRFGEVDWDLTIVGRPDGPWQVGVLGTAPVDTDGASLAVGIDDNDTSLSVQVTGSLFRTGDNRVPRIAIGGEEMTVSAISGASSPQTFTVVRSANGVTKSHAAGDAVTVVNPLVAAP